jgi:hypothetical protein
MDNKKDFKNKEDIKTHITFKDIIASSILIGIALWGIFFFGK